MDYRPTKHQKDDCQYFCRVLVGRYDGSVPEREEEEFPDYAVCMDACEESFPEGENAWTIPWPRPSL